MLLQSVPCRRFRNTVTRHRLKSMLLQSVPCRRFRNVVTGHRLKSMVLQEVEYLLFCLKQSTAGVVVSLLCLALASVRSSALQLPSDEMGIKFVNVSDQAGIKHKTVYGDEHKNRYLLETTGCGVAFIDFDNDGWQDVFLVNGTRLDELPKGQSPTNHLYRNNGDGTFRDVTEKAGLARSGWGQSVCIGDFDNDGNVDIFISYFGKNALYRNNGNGTFTDVAEKTGVANNRS